jgi:hypothetical protein
MLVCPEASLTCPLGGSRGRRRTSVHRLWTKMWTSVTSLAGWDSRGYLPIEHLPGSRGVP